MGHVDRPAALPLPRQVRVRVGSGSGLGLRSRSRSRIRIRIRLRIRSRSRLLLRFGLANPNPNPNPDPNPSPNHASASGLPVAADSARPPASTAAKGLALKGGARPAAGAHRLAPPGAPRAAWAPVVGRDSPGPRELSASWLARAGCSAASYEDAHSPGRSPRSPRSPRSLASPGRAPPARPTMRFH